MTVQSAEHIIGDISGANGVKKLNSYLQDRSYIEGYTVSQADYSVFTQLSTPPSANFPHALRWYNHITFFNPSKTIHGEPTTSHIVAVKDDVDDNDDDIDLFGSDGEEDKEAERIREERLQAYSAKKAKKPEVIAKSSIVLDVKPWDDETDMKKMEDYVRNITMVGLVWGASKLVPVGYGINKLQIMCVVEDDKVSIDDLTEEIEKCEDFVQSVDIAAFNKI